MEHRETRKNQISLGVAIMAMTVLMGACAPASLPHRPMSEIDIQGHQPADCGDRIPYYLVDEDGSVFLYCMPIKRNE